MNDCISLIISIFAILIAGGALINTLTTSRRNNKRIQREKKSRLLQNWSDLRMTYSVLLSDVLTRDLKDFRKEMQEIIIVFRKQLPIFIEQIDSAHTILQNIPYDYEVEIEKIAVEINKVKTGLQGIVEQLKHGFERGQK